MSEYVTRSTRLSVMLKGDPIFAESVTHVEIDDEAAGEFVTIRQIHDSINAGEISVENGQWEAIKAAVDQLLSEGISLTGPKTNE